VTSAAQLVIVTFCVE
jgi:hypothetical protein